MQLLLVVDQERLVSLIRPCPWRVVNKLEQLQERPSRPTQGRVRPGQLHGVAFFGSDIGGDVLRAATAMAGSGSSRRSSRDLSRAGFPDRAAADVRIPGAAEIPLARDTS